MQITFYHFFYTFLCNFFFAIHFPLAWLFPFIVVVVAVYILIAF